MLGLFVGIAARTAISAVVYHHMNTQASARALASMPFALHPRAGGESALFEHRRVRFAHLVPGFPRASMPTIASIEHPHDALLALASLPICLRYHATIPRMTAASPNDLAVLLAHSYVGQRSAAPPVVRPASPTAIAAWAVDGGALAGYDLLHPDPFGADHEELIVVVRAGHAMAISYRYARAEVHWLSRAFFVSAANASLSWDKARLAYAEIWPQSSFLEPNLTATLLPHRVAEIPYIAAEMNLSAAERDDMETALRTIIVSDAPPWADVVHADAVASLTAPSKGRGLRAVVERQMYGVRTVHDLRGLALQMGHAIAGAAPT